MRTREIGWVLLFIGAAVVAVEPVARSLSAEEEKPVQRKAAADTSKSTNANDTSGHATSAQLKFFEARVRPLLVTQCVKCHGPDKQEGELRLDSRAAIIAGGESGPAITSGKPDESLLIQAVRHESLEMPPEKQLSPREIESLAQWIRTGAAWPKVDPANAHLTAKITEKDRQFWSFQPVRHPTVPNIKSDWAKTDIDRFILAKSRDADLHHAPRADRRTLLRRVMFDLHGLPPTPRQTEEFETDTSPDAFARLVDRLLESDRYGQRYAQHWLDLVRYSESDGYKADGYRPHAWRYRDYVIGALNKDKPYDRFIAEQLAGDEIAPDDPEALVATGYLRLWIYEYNQRDVRTQWSAILDDLTDVTADVFLGMGMSCARCHDHKFDPILREDYFALRAFFAPLVARDDLVVATQAEKATHATQLKKWQTMTGPIRSEIDKIRSPFWRNAAHRVKIKFPPAIQKLSFKSKSERTPSESQLYDLVRRQVVIEQIASDKKIKGDSRKKFDALLKKLGSFKRHKPAPLPPAYVATDLGPVAPPTMIPGRKEGREIRPGFLTVLGVDPPRINPPSSGTSTGRRTALVNWLIDKKNPLTARVMVNRIWQFHFGRGLVGTASDFGSLGDRPSHPELLDYLAVEFIENGYSIKHIHRLIMNSAVYQQASRGSAAMKSAQKDPDNRLLARMTLRRLDAEQIRDATLAVSGELDTTAGGPSSEWKTNRRSIYLKRWRNRPNPLLSAFDAPDGYFSVSRRDHTITPSQALLRINGDWTLRRADALARRIQQQTPSLEKQIAALYQECFSRSPTTKELSAAIAFIAKENTLVDFCHVLLNSNEFITLD